MRKGTPGISFGLIWESLKAYIRGQIISYSAKAKRTLEEHRRRIESEILQLDAPLAHSYTPDLFKQRSALQTEFNLITTTQADTRLNKSRHRIYEHGEKTGKY